MVRAFDNWPLTATDLCEVPPGFLFDDCHEDPLHFDERPIALFARSLLTTWVATQADEDGDRERWCCAPVSSAEETEIRSNPDTLRRRAIWERDSVLVIECSAFAGDPIAAWRVPADRLCGLRCVFHDEVLPVPTERT